MTTDQRRRKFPDNRLLNRLSWSECGICAVGVTSITAVTFSAKIGQARLKIVDQFMRTASILALFLSVATAYFLGRYVGVEWVDWNLVDVLLVIFGGAAFFAVTYEAAHFIPANQLPYKESRAESLLWTIQYVARKLPNTVCIKFVSGPFSPDSLEEDQKQHDMACPWAKETAEKILALNLSDLPELNESMIDSLPSEVTDNYIVGIRDDFCQDVKAYQSAREDAARLKRKLNRTILEDFFVLLSPFFVSAAIGLSLFKALYEPG